MLEHAARKFLLESVIFDCSKSWRKGPRADIVWGIWGARLECSRLSFNGHLKLVPAFLYSLYLTLYKTDTSIRRTPRVGPAFLYSLYFIVTLYKTEYISLRWIYSAGLKGVHLRESWPYWEKLIPDNSNKSELSCFQSSYQSLVTDYCWARFLICSAGRCLITCREHSP